MIKQLIAWLLFDQTLTIRTLDEHEKPRLVEIFNASRLSAGCFRQSAVDLNEFTLQTQGEVIYVAEIGGQVAGFVSVWEREGFIHHLYVSPNFQGRGIGSALLQRCEDQYGLPLSLKCISANRRALNFYRRHGWVSNGCGVGAEGPWEKLCLNKV